MKLALPLTIEVRANVVNALHVPVDQRAHNEKERLTLNQELNLSELHYQNKV